MDASPQRAAPPSPRFPNAKLRPARSLRLAYGLIAAWAALVSAVVVGLPELRALMGGFGALMFVAMGTAIGRLRSQTPPGGGQLEAQQDGLHVEGQLAIPRSTMARATVEDGGADPTARAAAAIALGPALDDADRERLQGIARVVVSPRLRVAIEAAAAGGDDDAAVHEALAELEVERDQGRGARR